MDHGQAHGPLWTSSRMGPLGHGSALELTGGGGRKRERGARGTHLGPNYSSGSGVAAG
jgi:hypothetical protein